MDILKRVKRILKAAVNDLVEQAQDPELELAGFIEECEMALAELRAEIEDARLRSESLERELDGHRQSAAEGMSRAEGFAAADRKPEALEALRQRREALDQAALAEASRGEARTLVAALAADALALEDRLRNARQEQKRLSTQLRGAEAHERAGKLLMRPDRSALIREKMQDRILAGQAAGEAGRQISQDTTEAGFRELEEETGLEDEFAALMEKVKKQK